MFPPPPPLYNEWLLPKPLYRQHSIRIDSKGVSYISYYIGMLVFYWMYPHVSYISYIPIKMILQILVEYLTLRQRAGEEIYYV